MSGIMMKHTNANAALHVSILAFVVIAIEVEPIGALGKLQLHANDILL